MGIVTNGLVAYYNSKNGINGSVWENISPNTTGNYNGTISGALVSENGMTFDGIDDHVDIVMPDIFKSARELTFEFRANIEINQYEYPELFTSGVDSILYAGNDGSWTINSLVFDGMFVESDDDRTYDTIFSNTDSFISITVNPSSGRVTIYTNGVQSYTYAGWNVVPLVGSNGILTVGTLNLDSSPKGIIDNIRIYDRILSAEEIQENYSIGTEVGVPIENKHTIVTDGLVGYWHYNKGIEGNTWNNIAPNSTEEYYGNITGATSTDNGMYFDGIDDNVDLIGLDEFVTNPNTFTIEVVFSVYKWEVASIYDSIPIIYGGSYGNIIGIDPIDDGSYSFSGWLTSADWSNNYEYTYPINKSDEIIHITISYNTDSQVARAYIDGELVLTDNNVGNDLAINAPESPQIGIGGIYVYKDARLGGRVYSTRIYNKELTQEEVLQNYNVGTEVGLQTEEPIGSTYSAYSNLIGLSTSSAKPFLESAPSLNPILPPNPINLRFESLESTSVRILWDYERSDND